MHLLIRKFFTLFSLSFKGMIKLIHRQRKILNTINYRCGGVLIFAIFSYRMFIITLTNVVNSHIVCRNLCRKVLK